MRQRDTSRAGCRLAPVVRPAARHRRLRADERRAGAVSLGPQPAHRARADGDRRARRDRHDDDHRQRRHRSIGRIDDRADQRRDRGAAAGRRQAVDRARRRRARRRSRRVDQRPGHHAVEGAAVHRHARHARRRARRGEVAGGPADGQRAGDLGQRAGGYVPHAVVADRRAGRVDHARARDRDDHRAAPHGLRPARVRDRLERSGGARLRRRRPIASRWGSTGWPACSSGCRG